MFIGLFDRLSCKFSCTKWWQLLFNCFQSGFQFFSINPFHAHSRSQISFARGFDVTGEGFQFHVALSYYVILGSVVVHMRARGHCVARCRLRTGSSPFAVVLPADHRHFTSPRQNSNQRPGHLHVSVWGAKHVQCASHLPTTTPQGGAGSTCHSEIPIQVMSEPPWRIWFCTTIRTNWNFWPNIAEYCKCIHEILKLLSLPGLCCSLCQPKYRSLIWFDSVRFFEPL